MPHQDTPETNDPRDQADGFHGETPSRLRPCVYWLKDGTSFQDGSEASPGLMTVTACGKRFIGTGWIFKGLLLFIETDAETEQRLLSEGSACAWVEAAADGHLEAADAP